ncbi:MAG: tRNA pseudouridine(55) synthase TruB [Cyclobacteriaceae bacterium]|nr:tRNA pseudouridine(55) synthase TruB [Cyclobacteriaceae bacterium]
MNSGEPVLDKIWLINKPYNWTSFDVVNKLRSVLKIKKIGHTGTLDPLATGLLIICTGKLTKQIESFMGFEKEYTGIFVLGQTSPSHDLETELSEKSDVSHVTEEMIQEAANQLTGKIHQLPPLHSAIKIGGKRAYSYARKGKEINLSPRLVEVSEFTITKVSLPQIEFKIVCSKGTYIRSLVRDIGQIIGVGAYLSQLCRTRIGSYRLEDSIQIEEVTL